jgi:hypothetical protein
MRKHSRRPSGAYLNVDLEVRATFDLKALVKALSRTIFNLHSGRVDGVHFSSFESPGCGSSPEDVIGVMVKAVEGLPRQARALWDRAADRVFEIGIEHARGAWREHSGVTVRKIRSRIKQKHQLAVFDDRK